MVLITESEIEVLVTRLAGRINEDYADKELLLVPVLKGAFIFAADLIRKITVPVEVDFIAVRSYSSTTSSGEVELILDLQTPIENRHVLVIEDIVDTGLTLTYLRKNLLNRNPASLRICTLLDKPARRQIEIEPEYLAQKICDVFAVGYGLDLDERYRGLPHIEELATKL